MPNYTIKNMLALVGFVALVVAFLVLQRDLSQKSSELTDLRRKLGDGNEGRTCQVVLNSGWAESIQVLGLSPTSPRRKFTVSYSSSEVGDDNLGLSFSLCYVGEVSLKNGFDTGEDTGNGHLIAAKISLYDHRLRKTTESTTKYILYQERETIAYQNGKIIITLKPPAK